jgi:hypothetical protein
MRGCERHVTMFMFRGLTAEVKNLGMMEMSLAAGCGAWVANMVQL